MLVSASEPVLRGPGSPGRPQRAAPDIRPGAQRRPFGAMSLDELEEKVLELQRYKINEEKQKAREQAQKKKDLGNARRKLQREVQKTHREVRNSTAEVEAMERNALKLTDAQIQARERYHSYCKNYESRAIDLEHRNEDTVAQLQDKMSDLGHARGRYAHLQFALRSLDDNLVVDYGQVRPRGGPALTESLRWEVEDLSKRSENLERENARLQQELSELRRMYQNGGGSMKDASGAASLLVPQGAAEKDANDQGIATISRATTSATSPSVVSQGVPVRATVSLPVNPGVTTPAAAATPSGVGSAEVRGPELKAAPGAPKSSVGFQQGGWPIQPVAVPPGVRPLTMSSVTPTLLESQASTAAPSPGSQSVDGQHWIDGTSTASTARLPMPGAPMPGVSSRYSFGTFSRGGYSTAQAQRMAPSPVAQTSARSAVASPPQVASAPGSLSLVANASRSWPGMVSVKA